MQKRSSHFGFRHMDLDVKNTTDNLRRALFSLKDDSDFKNFKRDTFPLNLDFRFGLDSLNFKWNAFFLDLNFRFSTWTGTNTLAWHLEKQTLLLAHKEHFGSTPEGNEFFFYLSLIQEHY
ncbi:hypothetical protein RCL_jg6935.t1 [Rhizophagus clarus]|uniref:Uncharacterized protein n=1 Tax=Rhizophagus clarus TaxID=94130 RepID=A0A8H3LDD9_9GLOM|nr:hypothetical protein RCL_jg6935.t1 [Rhizophagus clarus]